jgi:hypothetical protein
VNDLPVSALIRFFVFEGDDKRVIQTMAYRAKNVDAARDYARSILKNVLLKGGRANRCEVKDQMGNILPLRRHSYMNPSR